MEYFRNRAYLHFAPQSLLGIEGLYFAVMPVGLLLLNRQLSECCLNLTKIV